MPCRILDTNNCIKYAQPTGRMRSGADWLADDMNFSRLGWKFFSYKNILSASLIFCLLLLQHKKMEVKGF
jgi:hypothetical protein